MPLLEIVEISKKIEFLNDVSLCNCFNNFELLDCIRISKKSLETNCKLLYNTKKKFIVNIENVFIYFKNSLDQKNKVIHGIFNGNVYFKKDLIIINSDDLKDIVEHKVEFGFKFVYHPFSISYIFSWLF